jgi:2-polyprenyl-3-methyl-5-hydroxy-6-metoxy-1,4-benzoquinol methylase
MPICLLCGQPGRVAYEGLRDRLFGATGTWTFLRCARDQVWWLSPRPTKEDLPLAYREYYTHTTEAAPSGFRRRFGVARDAMLAETFGYPTRSAGSFGRGLAKVLVRVPGLADIAGAAVLWLPARPGKRLLDVGCGAGLFAGRMMQFGWEVTGIEPDPPAARKAHETYGFPVFTTSVEEAAIAGERYDAVTAAHVIEHVPDPVAFLATCWSLVAPGGRLVVLTPNVESRAHHVFGPNWRGLEPPRHLVLFSLRSLELAADRAGLRGATVRTSARAASFMWLMSDALRRHQGSAVPFAPSFSPVDRIRALRLLIAELIVSGAAGEELVLTATKPGDTRS